MGLSLIDYIIIAILLVIVICISYFYFWKNRKKPCHGCPYSKGCSSCCSENKKDTKDKETNDKIISNNTNDKNE